LSIRHNDIFSYRKEQVSIIILVKTIAINPSIDNFKAEPEAVPHNTIHILQRERNLTLQQSFDFAGELLKQAVQRWYWTQQHLPSFGEHADVQVQRYLEGLLDQVKANLHWSFASGRYFGKDSEEARKTMTLKIPIFV
jgi:hypothetical protein